MPRVRSLTAAFRFVVMAILPVIFSCGGPAAEPGTGSGPEPMTRTDQRAASETSSTRDAPQRVSSVPRIVFLGDSLTAGFGLGEEQAFPAIIGRRLTERGLQARVVNAGVSGDTSAGGLSRLEWLLRQQPNILVVGLGANDGLRGLSVKMTESNLRRILLTASEVGALPVLLGIKLPPNLGADYVSAFESIYPRLAEELDVPLVPFMLEGVAGDPDLNLPDGIHPTAAGHQRVADNVLPWVEEALERVAETDGSAQDGAENGAP